MAEAAGDNRWFKAPCLDTARKKWLPASYLPFRHTPHTFTLDSPIQSHPSSLSGFDKTACIPHKGGRAEGWDTACILIHPDDCSGSQEHHTLWILYPSWLRARGDTVGLDNNSSISLRTKDTVPGCKREGYVTSSPTTNQWSWCDECGWDNNRLWPPLSTIHAKCKTLIAVGAPMKKTQRIEVGHRQRHNYYSYWLLWWLWLVYRLYQKLYFLSFYKTVF